MRIIPYLALVLGTSVASAAGITEAEQNTLMKSYCAVCHTDAVKNGGLSLEHFDASHADPGDAAMALGKILDGALGAAGLKPPDDTTVTGWQNALAFQSLGAGAWTTRATGELTTVSIVRQVRPVQKPKRPQPNLYRLTATCDRRTGRGEMQVAWSPDVPAKDQTMTARADAATPVAYTLSAVEKMGNGTNGASGAGFVMLSNKAVPQNTLLIQDAFPGEAVTFPFNELDATARRSLAACFP